MFEFLSFELIVHDSAGGVVFRVVTWIITLIIGAVPAHTRKPRKRPQREHRANKVHCPAFLCLLCVTLVRDP